MGRLVPSWLADYRRDWLGPDVVAGLIIWSVVVPQAVAYAQIAGLPPSAGLIAAPGALLAYALLGTSRTLVVSATTATSALSAVAVGPLADGDAARFAALSAGLAVVSAAVLIGAGLLRLGGVMDLVSKPVMTGFLFGLGLTVAVGQLPKIFGLEERARASSSASSGRCSAISATPTAGRSSSARAALRCSLRSDGWRRSSPGL